MIYRSEFNARLKANASDHGKNNLQGWKRLLKSEMGELKIPEYSLQTCL